MKLDLVTTKGIFDINNWLDYDNCLSSWPLFFITDTTNVEISWSDTSFDSYIMLDLCQNTIFEFWKSATTRILVDSEPFWRSMTNRFRCSKEAGFDGISIVFHFIKWFSRRAFTRVRKFCFNDVRLSQTFSEKICSRNPGPSKMFWIFGLIREWF